MEYVHIRSLEHYHPGYKDRDLKWAKIYFDMVQGDPDCELIEDEVDFARLIKMIVLELQAQGPLPNTDAYWSKKGFNLKKREMSLTLQMLQKFVEVVTEEKKDCTLDKDKEDKDKDKQEKSERSPGPDPEYLFLANLLKDLMVKNNPKAVIKKTQIEKWANIARLMHEQDKISVVDIKTAIEKSQADHEFRGSWRGWSAVIHSMNNLRQHFNKLITLKEGKGNGPEKVTGAAAPQPGKYAGLNKTKV